MPNAETQFAHLIKNKPALLILAVCTCRLMPTVLNAGFGSTAWAAWKSGWHWVVNPTAKTMFAALRASGLQLTFKAA